MEFFGAKQPESVSGKAFDFSLFPLQLGDDKVSASCLMGESLLHKALIHKGKMSLSFLFAEPKVLVKRHFLRAPNKSSLSSCYLQLEDQSSRWELLANKTVGTLMSSKLACNQDTGHLSWQNCAEFMCPWSNCGGNLTTWNKEKHQHARCALLV